MPCGCTDNNKLNDNKGLDNDKKLSLESMQSLSIDEIINLYKQGYVLEGLESTKVDTKVEAMSVAYANIVDATGYYDPSLGETWVCVIFSNSGSCGWIRHLAGDDLGYVGEFSDRQQCFYSSSTGLLNKAWYSVNNPVNIAYIKMYTCDMTSNDTCYQAGCAPGTTAACTGNSSLTASIYGIGIGQFTSVVPNSPTNVVVTPGNGQLTLSWTPSTFVDPITGKGVFDYFLEVYDALGNGYDGHILGNATSFTFQNLTNGTQYTCTIRAISRCDTQSTKVTKTGTPTGPITGTIHFAVTTSDGGPINGFEIYLDGSSTMAGTTNTSGIFDATVTGSPSPGTSHSYRIHKTNYTDQTGSVLVISGQTSNVSKIMQATGPVLTTITVAPTTASINVGATQQLTAVCKDAGGATMTCPTLTWVSSNTAKATVSSSGLVTGVAAGSANITASASGVTSNISAITVTSPTSVLTSITISPASQSINTGGIVQLIAVCKDQNNLTMTCPTLTWVSSLPAKATVSSTGLVTGVSAGSTNITASVGAVTSNISAITVTGIVSTLTSIVVSPASASIVIGGTRQLTAVCKDQNNTTMTCPTLTWVSSLPAKATVSSSGLVTGVAEGTSNVTASVGIIASNASIITVTTTPPPQAGGGGAMMIAAVAAIGIAYFMMKKPPTKP